LRIAVYSHQTETVLKKKINVAIDGHSSCGKSTLAKALAKELNYIYVDTGAMYRAMALYALQNKLIDSDGVKEERLLEFLDKVYITFKYNPKTLSVETYLNGSNVEKEIRSMQVSKYVSPISAIRQVRLKLVRLQQRMAENRGVIMDGRDIGSVVLPDAELKFFMTAEAHIRAERRFKELKDKGIDISFQEVLENVNTRDRIDSNREHDPLKQAEGAIVIDNSNLTLEEQFQFMLGHVKRVLLETEAAADSIKN
jgi:cytidylate kinase